MIGGFPCQDLSVAGKRAGLKGERSGLYWEVVRIVREMREATDGRYPAFVVLENVPGLLSSHGGRDFAAVLGGLRELGAAVGYRILDARFFGVPQRRRRVFIVAGFAGGCLRAQRTAEILSLLSRGSGDSAPSGEAGEGLAGDAEDGAGVVGELDLAYCLPASARGTGDAHGNAWNTTYVANSVTSSAGHHDHSSPRGDGSDNLIPIDLRQTSRGELLTNNRAHGSGGPPGVGVGDDGDPAFTVSERGQAVAITENLRAEVRETPYANSVAGQGGKPGQGYQAVREGMAVRRLTPRETERLQGWPDDWTRWRADGREIPDGPRYRLVGNGVASPVAAWIARRMLAVLSDAPPGRGATGEGA